MTDRELMQQALGYMESVGQMDMYPEEWAIVVALRERLAQPQQEFTAHEEGEDGWSDWVCPDPKSYLMKCCDCGLVHEAQFKVVRYKSEAEREDCEPVDDPNLQAVFRMRRSEQWSPKDTAYRPGGLAQTEQEQWDAIPDAFNEWWNADYDDTGNPYRKDSAAYWAWSGWKAASKQPEQEPVFDCPRCGHCCPQSNILAAWMIQRSYATGHGDTVEDLLKELEWQIAEREREACAKVCEDDFGNGALNLADAIRARGNT